MLTKWYNFVIVDLTDPQRRIQKHLRTALRRRCRNFLSNEWLPASEAKTFPLRKYYVQGKWEKKVKKALKDTNIELLKIHDIFENEYQDGPVNILAIGE